MYQEKKQSHHKVSVAAAVMELSIISHDLHQQMELSKNIDIIVGSKFELIHLTIKIVSHD